MDRKFIQSVIHEENKIPKHTTTLTVPSSKCHLPPQNLGHPHPSHSSFLYFYFPEAEHECIYIAGLSVLARL